MTDNAESLNEAIWQKFIKTLPANPDGYAHKKKDFMVAAMMVTVCMLDLIENEIIKPSNVLQFLELLSKDLEKWGEIEFGAQAETGSGVQEECR